MPMLTDLLPPHHCHVVGEHTDPLGGTYLTVGNVWRCDECGQHWRTVTKIDHGQVAPNIWVKCSAGRARRLMRKVGL